MRRPGVFPARALISRLSREAIQGFRISGFEGGVNLYEYVGGRASVHFDPNGEQDYGTSILMGENNLSPGAGNSPVFHPPSFIPAPANSPLCDKYPCHYTYLGANARCFCKCAGDSPWSQYVRGCLAKLYSLGATAEEAHLNCYLWATEEYGVFSIPVWPLLNCFRKCFGLKGDAPTWPWPTWPQPPIAN